ncbi:Ribonuclease/ribotoxin [Xylaria arbuscula]|nr:Ribonuclease/ribotoxin [Xylaria arbuscula]
MMHVFTSFLALVAIVTPALSAPLLEERAATTCGSTSYTATQVNQAAQKAYSDYKAGSAPSGYPHTYNNYEGFSFPVAGPYLEFPLLSSGVFTGGSPGADRVIINTSAKLAGAITHTGASGNNFVGCSGTS